ncbi:glycosyltransferase family 4 protein [Candidatus Nitrosotenuis cloacae]|uniref:Glycosyl transferase n=1 Tax=Candidatus Nitrosotenuis cloacae TaxID=1603555 RepID=A0A3G1B5N1_9ARCH|nr:glycosyltransferase family 4 protein [Candidatus Nitrosotenuis cloacae]AJZ76134.1 glycosyl transferase [Candidatus Nitrosotenuis cloacae]
MKILYISPRFEGGIGGHAFGVAEKLRENGFDVKLMQVSHIPINNLKNPSFALFGALKAIFDREKYDAVHAWNVPSAIVMKFIKARKKILSVHGVYSEQVNVLHSDATSSIVNSTEAKILKLADILTTDSKSVQKTYKEKLGLDFVYLPAPIDTEKFKEIPEVKKIENQVVFVGRDSYEKGVDILKNIEPKITGKVIYCTNLSWKDAMTNLKASAVLVVPSRMESLPQSIKEAFYLKIPVVATNVGDIPDVVTNNETGLLIPPNDPQSLINAINSSLEQKENSARMASNAYDFVTKNFTWEELLPKYVDFYEKLLN